MLPRLVSGFPATAAEGGGVTPWNLMLSIFSPRQPFHQLAARTKELKNFSI
jgi:hypothetical protein